MLLLVSTRRYHRYKSAKWLETPTKLVPLYEKTTVGRRPLLPPKRSSAAMKAAVLKADTATKCMPQYHQ